MEKGFNVFKNYVSLTTRKKTTAPTVIWELLTYGLVSTLVLSVIFKKNRFIIKGDQQSRVSNVQRKNHRSTVHSCNVRTDDLIRIQKYIGWRWLTLLILNCIIKHEFSVYVFCCSNYHLLNNSGFSTFFLVRKFLIIVLIFFSCI
jgi:hypothetical protein